MKESTLRALWRPWARLRRDTEDPIRAELFSVERLEQHAESLAAAQRVTRGARRGRQLTRRLRANGRVLLAAYRDIGASIREERIITPAAEWLVDNFHVVEEQIREIRDDLPRNFYRQLPKLANGPLRGNPRVFGLAWAFVAHTDSHFDPQTLVRFVRAYQRVQPLTIGELWAVAITLRIVLVENTRRAADQIVSARVARQHADAIADRLLDSGDRELAVATATLRGFDRRTLPREFVVQLIQRLRDHDPTVTPALAWLDERLAAQGTTADALVSAEHQRQGAMNVTVRNAITSMRLISASDWAEFFESVSGVDAVLRAGSDFGEMSFATRDRYRHAIEELARGTKSSEIEIARRVIESAQRSPGESKDRDVATCSRERDPGYFLIGRGRVGFERELSSRAPFASWLARIARRAGTAGYVGTIAGAGALALGLLLLAMADAGVGAVALFALGLLAAVPISEAAVVLVNAGVTRRLGPQALPELELRDGVPPSLRTMVVMPTLLSTRAEVEEQIERLEVHALANSDGDLRFALLSDWRDAPAEHVDGDDEILGAAREAVARLNQRHGPAADGDRFLLLHRRRVWSESESLWIGWERKRGKLHELNRLLRGAADTTFLEVDGRPPAIPAHVRYVITLDSDTRMPRGVARRLVGKMAHALNRPSFDAAKGRVVEGHAVLQPRVTPSLPMGRDGSFFQRAVSGPGGMDPYAFAVSDVYQDLFGEGSFSGKGIYDVDAFEAALEGRIPPASLLSHDLFEGIFARAGLASDIEVFEEHPSRYDVAASRLHRWARGDWQLLPWLLGIAPRSLDSKLSRERAAIPRIGRWKMIDNLRRTLVAPAAFASLVAGWTLPLDSARIWTAAILAALAVPAVLPLLSGILPRQRGISKRSHLRGMRADLGLALSQIGLLVTFVAHQAWLMSDAILRTLFRLFVSHRRLLEWVTAAQSSLGARLSLRGFAWRMAGSSLLAVAAATLVASRDQGALALSAPFLLLWALAPGVAWWASLPPARAQREAPSAADVRALRAIARRTWRFFESFVGASEQMLPPDNFQEDPKPVIAHRTSPTNLGLYLLSVVAARDFGWIGTLDAADRLRATLATMQRLERFRGHFYNWYDTQDLRPLDPKYVSSVDSGNLAGHLITLQSACQEMIDLPLVAPAWAIGIADTLELARGALRTLADDRRTQTVTRKQLHDAIDAIAAALAAVPVAPAAIATRLAELAVLADTLTDIARTFGGQSGDAASAELLAWTEAVRSGIRAHARDFDSLMPWASLAADREALGPLCDAVPSLAALPDLCEIALGVLASRSRELSAGGEALARADGLAAALERSAFAARSLERRLAALAQLASDTAAEMEFGCLFDSSRQLLSIGFRVGEGSLDPSCYDLLASEARLASFVAIAKGDIPGRHWFRLGRSLTPVDRGSALISWSGSMFEYLMPSLVMRAPARSVLEHTSHLIVRRQEHYGAELGVPWGVSESAYNARDLEFTYQYSSFGVPGLGLKRGLSGDAVIAPYATALAAMVDPQAAVRNFSAIAAAGGMGRYGCYEALDYTATRLAKGESVSIVRAFMAHHQGMTLVAIDNAINDGVMRARFHAVPMIKATELLLQERTARNVVVARPRAEEVGTPPNVRDLALPLLRRFQSPHDLIPRTHLLSNGRYAVMITAAGSGYSAWRRLAVTRWREDVTCDSYGSYVFLRDTASGEVWSAGYQPSGAEPDRYEVAFSEGRAEIVRRDGSLVTTLEVAVSSEDDGEVRRVSISNLGSRAREIELTSYSELVLAPAASDAAHPAFSKLFVQTELVADVDTLLATRRLRSPGEACVWAAHLAVVEGEGVGTAEFETDRARFVGRGHALRAPISIIDGSPLSGSVGTVLDPIFSIRRRVRIAPGATARVAFWTLIAPSRSAALDLADRHRDATAFDRVLTLAWTQAQVELHHLGIEPDEAHVFQRLANRVLFSDPTLRPPPEVLSRGRGDVTHLWALGISGDLPIVLVRIDDLEDVQIVRQLLRAHEYWRMKGVAVDLVIINERPASYLQELQASLEAAVRASPSRPQADAEGARGSVFVLRGDLMHSDARDALRTAARAVLLSRRGSLAEQVRRLEEPRPAAAPPPAVRANHLARPERPLQRSNLEFFNGLGGFAAGGREYVTTLADGQWTPAPWINVIASPSFGFQVSVEGGGYTWAGNARENQLTPWSNDPVGDPPGETIYVRDEDSGALFGPTALPTRDPSGPYVATHGQGYSRFEHSAHGIALELLQFVPEADPIKLSRLVLENRSERARRLSVTLYVEWVLGASREATAPFVVTERDMETGALFARNSFSSGAGVAFADLGGRQLACTGDRTEFLGRNGAPARPAALCRDEELSNQVGAGLDPCGVLQTSIALEPDERVEIRILLGQTKGAADARALITRYRAADLDETLRAVVRRWDDLLETVQVKTPDRSFDILLNRWLLYQTLACRLWARSAFHQASGAYGFRDQLQDGMALAVARPELTREHLLRAAARQFREGDVQHWWLPASGRGVRTRISDDLLWLPHAVAQYVEVTGDAKILDEGVAFLDGPALREGEHEQFFEPSVSEHTATLFEHCARALDRSLTLGSHGLPLFGGGDWNDGMNRVGREGKGESVWLGWFLFADLIAFAPLAESRGERVRAASWRRHAAELQESLEREAWDGNWYRRGSFDDGTPLGAAGSDACRIDSIAQSWAVISGAADRVRAARAMAAVDEHLVRRADRLVLLFTPPFDFAGLDPGYIQGYPPGVRENGGQYTHAALWSAQAFAMLGDGERAAELFSFVNPIRLASTRAASHRYKAEPYVVSADVYSEPPHVGRAGWSWYTGSAAWMYRVGLESMLGFQLRGEVLRLNPCVPKSWPGFEIAFRYRSSRYEISVTNPRGVCRGVTKLEIDGAAMPGDPTRISLIDDGATHRVHVSLG
jgi:cyclic beta-1,2-glucan synthetase